jgi:CO/xanthine dehydrogenase FAD-binding subunit
MIEGEFFKANDPREACELLARYKAEARILAGGTDLMVGVHKRKLAPKVLVYIGECGLNYIKAENNNLVIGAATPFAEIMRSPLVKEKAPLLAETVSHIAGPAIRNVGTIGGNLANASPAADSATALLALGAGLKLISKEGERTVDCNSFFLGPDQTVLKPGELIREVTVPVQAAGSKWAYRKMGKRKAQSLSIASVAVYCQPDGGVCRDIRIALGAVAPTPILATKAAALLQGKRIDANLIEKAAKTAADETSPIDDVRSSAWYRRRAVEAMVKQLLGQIFG